MPRDRPARALLAYSTDAMKVLLANGALFDSVLAFSPGFVAAPELHGKPGGLHLDGSKDAVLPVEPLRPTHCGEPEACWL
jgi:hypothetical protein